MTDDIIRGTLDELTVGEAAPADDAEVFSALFAESDPETNYSLDEYTDES